MIERINVREFNFCKVLLSCRKAFISNDKYLCILSFLGLITIFYLIEAYSWLKPKEFIPRYRIFQRLGY